MTPTDATDEGLGQAIRRARIRSQFTQAQVAAQLAISQAQVSAWETGRTLPNEAQLEALKRLLRQIRRSRRSDAWRGGDGHQLALVPEVAAAQPTDAARPVAGSGERRRRGAAPGPPASNGLLDVPALEQWLWDAACQIRGPLDAPKFKDYILPLIFLKRLSDVFEDEVARVSQEVGDPTTALEVIGSDHGLVRFFIPPEGRWSFVRDPPAWAGLPKPPRNLGEALTDATRAVARANPRLEGVINTVDFNATTAGQPIIDHDRLAQLIDTLSRHRLGLTDVEPDILGRAYEYLLRKFAEGQGQSAGEFFTPPEVARLMARLLDPQPGATVYDPACGSAGLLIKCHLRLLETHGVAVNEHRALPKDVAPLHLFGQEINASTFAMAKMNAVLHDMDADIALGDTMRRPAFIAKDGRVRRFDFVTANPMWNQDIDDSLYRSDTYERFSWGVPPSSSADWGWAQHMVASLGDDGRMAIVLDTGSVSRGSGGQGANRERDVRKAFVDADLVEAVILLPENLFYNTSAPGIVMILNRAKAHPDEILLVNGSQMFTKGRPKNFLADDHIAAIGDLYAQWAGREGRSVVVTTGDVVANDYNLSPSRYVTAAGGETALPVAEAARLLREAESEQARASEELWRVLAELGVE